MHGTGFELMDMLLCCKFAEGDSRILQMKLARDRLKKVMKQTYGRRREREKQKVARDWNERIGSEAMLSLILDDAGHIKTLFFLLRLFLTLPYSFGEFGDGQPSLKVKKDGVVATLGQCLGEDRAEAMAALSLARKLQPAGRDLKQLDKVNAQPRCHMNIYIYSLNTIPFLYFYPPRFVNAE
jgi:hypothetical protein